MTPSGDGIVNSRVRAYTRRRADAPRQLDSSNALDLNWKMQRGPLRLIGPEAESYTREKICTVLVRSKTTAMDHVRKRTYVDQVHSQGDGIFGREISSHLKFLVSSFSGF
jgi:hypothetical protein